MESKVRIILGTLLIFATTWQLESASLVHRFRPIRDVALPSIEDNTTVKSEKLTEFETVTNSSLSSLSSDKLDLQKNEASKESSIENKIKLKVNDPVSKENEHSKISGQEVPDPNEKPKALKERVKIKETNNDDESNKSDVQIEDDVADKSEGAKPATGRSLNIDIQKYISPDFHNKNNVYSMPTSPEIQKYLGPDSEELTEVTKSSVPKTSLSSRSTQTDFNNYDLTTPQSNIFDPKFQLAVDRIKQNLAEVSSNSEQFKQDEQNNFKNDDEDKYDVSKLIDNYKNADNETEISLHANEFKTIDLKTDKSKLNKGMESGKNVDYESKYFKTRTYEEKPENSGIINKSADSEKLDTQISEKQIKPTEVPTKIISVVTTTSKSMGTTLPTKKPRNQIALHNNTIETTASDSEIKPKTLRHFTSESTNIDPLFESEKVAYTKPAYENAINITKRGSHKVVTTSDKPTATTTTTTTITNFMDYDNKNFSIPPTATAWTLVSLKDVPPSTPSLKESDPKMSNEQNSQENQLDKIQTITDTTTEDIPKSTTTKPNKPVNKIDYSSTTDSTDATAVDNQPNSSTFLQTTKQYVSTTESPITETTEEIETSTETEDFPNTTELIKKTTNTILAEASSNDSENHEDETTENISFKTTTNFEQTTEETTIYPTTEPIITTTNFVTTESSIFDRNESESETTEEIITTTAFTEIPDTTTSASTESGYKHVPSKTENENELFTTITQTNQNKETTKSVLIIKPTTAPSSTTTKHHKTSTVSNLEEDEIDINSGGEDTDYSELSVKKDLKNITDVNDPEIEIVPIDNTEQSTQRTPVRQSTSTPKTIINTTPRTFHKDSKPIFGNNDVENSTIDATSSTESLSNGDGNNDNGPGMIAAIAISTIGGICLILLAGLLLIMRKRQKRVTYGQRCRPVSLDAYSLDNVSVYNSVRRKGAIRASKRSYGNPAFDDPVSISHQMNFQQLAKFVDNAEAINAEFEEIPQVTARVNEVPEGCETKNRYANVIPLPETRVFLKTFDNDPQSDYINANYVTGPKNTRGYYIATQGPMNSTVDDFWRMVWEQQCRVVLMLTNLYENGIEKCADYLPPSEVLDCHRLFGDFQITLKKREVKEKYIISSLQLKNMVSNSWREVTHLWYIGWPERGVPTEANSLIAFLIEARSHLKAASNNNSTSIDDKTSESPNIYISRASGSASESGPMVVHCSPGTGRTGTVIACDIAIRDFELTRNVDIPKIVYKVRRDRASAVQTREQYSFIYKLISLYATKLTGGALDSI